MLTAQTIKNEQSKKLWHNPAFLPKSISLSPHVMNQPIVLTALPADQADIRLELCPVRSVRADIDKTAAWCMTDQLFVCFSDARIGSVLSCQDSEKRRPVRFVLQQLGV